MAVAACSAPSEPRADRPTGPAAASSADFARAEAELVAQIRRLSIPYPNLTVTDVRFARGVTVACAVLRDGDKPPHAVLSLDDDPTDGRRTVLMPMLFAPGGWELPSNAELSDHARRQCREWGAPID